MFYPDVFGRRLSIFILSQCLTSMYDIIRRSLIKLGLWVYFISIIKSIIFLLRLITGILFLRRMNKYTKFVSLLRSPPIRTSLQILQFLLFLVELLPIIPLENIFNGSGFFFKLKLFPAIICLIFWL